MAKFSNNTEAVVDFITPHSFDASVYFEKEMLKKRYKIHGGCKLKEVITNKSCSCAYCNTTRSNKKDNCVSCGAIYTKMIKSKGTLIDVNTWN